MDEPPPLPPSENRTVPLIVGMLAANLVAAALFFGVKRLLDLSHGDGARLLAVPSLCLVPLVAGFVAAWCWRRLRPTLGDCLIHSLTTTLLGLAGAAVFIHEGAVCLVIAELVPNAKLTFDIIEQPTHPEAYGHITLHRGRFVLRDNGDGTTTLIGTSWYTLHVRPLWYFDLWTSDMTRAVHLRVMHHVRRLAEG